MAEEGKFLVKVAGRQVQRTANSTSAGVADADKLIKLNAAGKIDPTLLPDLDFNALEASENLDAGDFVNIFDDGGTIKVRKADSSNDRRAHGFVSSAYTAGQIATVAREGTNAALSGLTGGARYYLDTAGGVTTTPPNTSGSICQYVGTAVSATEINIEIEDETVIE